MIDVVIDLNVRSGSFGQLTHAGFEDIRGDVVPPVGTFVCALEEEEAISAPAIVVGLDNERRVIHLAVAWREFTDRPWGRWSQMIEPEVDEVGW